MKISIFIITSLVAGLVAGLAGNPALADDLDSIQVVGVHTQAPTHQKVFLVPPAGPALEALKASLRDQIDLDGGVINATVCTTARECRADARYPITKGTDGKEVVNLCVVTYQHKASGCTDPNPRTNHRTAQIRLDGRGRAVLLVPRQSGGFVYLVEEVAPTAGEVVTPVIAQATAPLATSAQLTQLAADQKATNEALLAAEERQRKQEAWSVAVRACEQRVDHFNSVRDAKVERCLTTYNNLGNIAYQVAAKDGTKIWEAVGVGMVKNHFEGQCHSRPTADKSICSTNPHYLSSAELASAGE